jgi:alpha/beta superfamily hydrolase
MKLLCNRKMSHQANTWCLLTLACRVILILCVMSTMLSNRSIALAQEADVETAVCGSVREPLMFWLWRSTAGSPNPVRVAQIANLEQIRFTTRDGIELGGYKLAAKSPAGYLLVAQGNAMLADQLVADLQSFRDLGLDVYIFDYRGYGISKGKSRLVAISGDYAEIVTHLNARRYEKRLLYGISMGGVILLNAVGRSQAYTRLVVDSSPSRISDFGCPERYDPVAHLPEDSSRLMIVTGSRDEVVRPAQMDELVRVARSRRGRVLQDNEFAHPYQDLSPATHRRRQNEVATFFLQD